MKTVLLLFLVSACSMLPFPGAGGGSTQAHRTETSSSSQTEEMNVNGKRVALDDEGDPNREPEEERPSSRKKPKRGGEDIGKTCHKNNECEFDACFVGAGDLGYCTRMCNSWTDCPSHWECKRAANAPQRICMQDND